MAIKTTRRFGSLTSEEINKGFEAAEARMRRGEEVENYEKLWPDEMQAAWKALSPERRIGVLDLLVGSGEYVDERVVALFPTLAETDDIATFGDIGGNNACANFRDSTLCSSFDFATNTFTREQLERTLKERRAQVDYFTRL